MGVRDNESMAFSYNVLMFQPMQEDQRSRRKRAKKYSIRRNGN